MTIFMNQDGASSQFREFASFVKSPGVNGRTIVQMGKFTSRAISIKRSSNFDFIGLFARSSTTKSENDSVRHLFKATIIKMFGGTDDNDLSCLPDSVRDALKFDDYGKGKPLSARRIRAVMTAVDQVVSERAKQVEGKLVAQGVTVDDDVKERITTAVATCHGDDDVFTALLQNPKGILFDSQSYGNSLRSNTEVAQRVKDLADEILLRIGTGGDQRLSEVAKPYLDYNGVMPLSKPLLTSMVTAVKQLKPADLADFAPLKPGVTAQDIQMAAIALDKLLAATTRQTSSRYVKTDDKAKTGYRHLLSSLILARAFPDKGSLLTAQTALESGAASKLKRKCLDSMADFAATAEISRGNPKQERTMRSYEQAWNHHLEMLDKLKDAVDRICCDERRFHYRGIDSAIYPIGQIKPSDHPIGEGELDPVIARRVGEDATRIRAASDHH